ncbi:FAD binding domain-containing protein [Lihuaxuella thermophila]|uniref:Carbon-monoxide dehydrogenase medium subunit n=1 Tax=Lihuaxuella thermophila TaxID=1173111 RepID=A0A1H8J6A6_9BACL|nr:xanthine dehydrogenase family protein subunit M [Lihuaxuella thermophila]SEN76209.1 carbon-monoxide dehydrogenase medium subunit [Lihuaxuella thermophila]
MIPSAFDYTRATSVEEAVKLLQAAGGEAKLLAGGHSLLPMMKIKLTSPGKLIDIGRIKELSGIRKEGNRLVVGALTTHRQVAADPLVRKYAPVLAEAASQIGDIQVRNRGTVGGNLAHADPASDLPAVALALEAEFEVQGPDGKETLDAGGFFLGPLITALPENSILTSVSFAIPPEGAKSTYLKYPHPASGYAVVGVAAVVSTGPDGMVNDARIGITGVADTAYRAEEAERALVGKKLSEQTILEVAALASEGQEMASDLFASAEYRRHLTRVYTIRALKRLLI